MTILSRALLAAATSALLLACGGLGAPTPADELAPAVEGIPGWLAIATEDGVVVPWTDPFTDAVPGSDFHVAATNRPLGVTFQGLGPEGAPCASPTVARFTGAKLPAGATWLVPHNIPVQRDLLTAEPPRETSLRWTAGEEVSVRMMVNSEGQGRLSVQQIEIIGSEAFSAPGVDLRNPVGVPLPESFLDVDGVFYLLTRRDDGTRRTYQLRNLDAQLSVAHEAVLEGC